MCNKYASNPDLLLQHMLVINGAASGNINAINQTIGQAEFYGRHYQGGRALASLFSEDYAISAVAASGAPDERGQVNKDVVAATAMIMAGVLGGLSSNADCSFNANTQVMTIDGEKAIVLVREGDKILAWNQEAGIIGYYTVTDTHAHLDHTLVYLTVDGETILTTPEHPFFTESGEWVGAGDLRVGSKVHQIDGNLGTVRKVDVVEQLQVMYNLTVADAHTFVVGDGQWLVHNGDCYRLTGTLSPIKDKQLKKWGIDAHKVKEGIWGEKAELKHYDLFVDEANVVFSKRKGMPDDTAEWVGPLNNVIEDYQKRK